MIDISKITHKFEVFIEITPKIDKMYEIVFSADDSLSAIFMNFTIKGGISSDIRVLKKTYLKTS